MRKRIRRLQTICTHRKLWSQPAVISTQRVTSGPLAFSPWRSAARGVSIAASTFVIRPLTICWILYDESVKLPIALPKESVMHLMERWFVMSHPVVQYNYAFHLVNLFVYRVPTSIFFFMQGRECMMNFKISGARKL